MLRTIKGTLTAVMLSSVAIAPVATVAFVGTADMAIAKSENAGGKGKGKGGSIIIQQQSGGSKGKSGGKSGGAGGKALGKLDSFLGKVTGSSSSSKSRGGLSKDDPMHPSNLGNMNGALNANENAILAHILNGNTNGPVGMMSALAVAGYNTADARALLDSGLAKEYAGLDKMAMDAGFDSYEAYVLAAYGDGTLDHPGDPTLINGDIDLAAAGIGSSAFEEALGDYDTYEEYQAKYIGSGTADSPEFPDLYDQDIEDAYANLGYNPDTASGFEQAGTDAQEYEDAMTAILDYWNKGDADSEDAGALRDALEARLAEYENVGATVDSMADATTTAEEECPEGEVCEAPEL